MSKEKILDEFDKIFENLKLKDIQIAGLLILFSKAIAQTREETIREVEEIVNKIIIKDYIKKWDDNVVDFAQDIVNRTTLLIKEHLNKLKK